MAWWLRQNTWGGWLTELGSSIVLVALRGEQQVVIGQSRIPVGILGEVNVVLPPFLHGLPCTRRGAAAVASFLLHVGFHLRIGVFALLPVFKLLMVLGGISRLGNGNVVSFSTAHLQLKCHLSVVFSDSTLSNSCPLSCFQAWKKRCCLVLDSFLWLGIEVFMGWSAVFSQGAEPNIGFSAQKLQGRSPAAETRKKFQFRLWKQLLHLGVERRASGNNSDSAVSVYMLKTTTSYKQNPKTPPKKDTALSFSTYIKFTTIFSISQVTTFCSCSYKAF